MLLGKTDKARAALQARSPALNALDRRLLILSDGQRSRASLLAMFGAGADANIERLLREGHLDAKPTPGTLQRRAGGMAAMPQGPRPPALPAAPTPAAARRSLAAAKMYVVDMLQLQRSEEAASLRAAIHAAPGEDDMVLQLCTALRHLCASTSASYGQRVLARFSEILPEPHLSRLQALLAPDRAAQSSAA